MKKLCYVMLFDNSFIRWLPLAELCTLGVATADVLGFNSSEESVAFVASLGAHKTKDARSSLVHQLLGLLLPLFHSYQYFVIFLGVLSDIRISTSIDWLCVVLLIPISRTLGSCYEYYVEQSPLRITSPTTN